MHEIRCIYMFLSALALSIYRFSVLHMLSTWVSLHQNDSQKTLLRCAMCFWAKILFSTRLERDLTQIISIIWFIREIVHFYDKKEDTWDLWDNFCCFYFILFLVQGFSSRYMYNTDCYLINSWFGSVSNRRKSACLMMF